MCALFGIFDYDNCFDSIQKEFLLTVLSHECEVRGTDATGIAYLRNGKLQVYKRPVPARQMQYRLPSKVKTVMGHTRMTTQGSEKNNCNNHPFVGGAKHNSFALAHNGVLRNDRKLRQSMKLPATKIETDSYIAVQLIEQENSVSFDSLRTMAETVRGSFMFTVLDKYNNLYFVRGDNPVCIYHFADKGFYLYASKEDILAKTVKCLGLNKYYHEEVFVDMGDILRIDDNGNMKKEQFELAEVFPSLYGYCQYPVYVYEYNYSKNTASNDTAGYLATLKQLSGLYGYTPDDIDELIEEGWTLEDIEQIMCGDNISYESIPEDFM